MVHEWDFRVDDLGKLINTVKVRKDKTAEDGVLFLGNFHGYQHSLPLSRNVVSERPRRGGAEWLEPSKHRTSGMIPDSQIFV